jgi:uncharacterized protein
MRKVILHVNEMDRWLVALTNAENLLKDVGKENAQVGVLANGQGVRGYVLPGQEFASRIEDLARNGVRFFACRNAIKATGIDEKYILKVVEIVPAGITLLIDCQNEDGFAYIKP